MVDEGTIDDTTHYEKDSRGEIVWRNGDTVFFGTRSTPTDSEYSAGQVALYFKSDDNLYKRPHGGSESQVGGSGALSDSGNDTDGGDDYRLPQAADNIDLQGSGGVRNADVVDTASLVNDRHYAGAFDGADADARLGNALSAASNGDTIYLENETYNSDLTTDRHCSLVGTEHVSGTQISDCTWTFDGRVVIKQVDAPSPVTFEFNSDDSGLINSRVFGTVNFNGEHGRYIGVRAGDVTFASGTTDGIVDSCQNVSVTDNGSNTIGDNA